MNILILEDTERQFKETRKKIMDAFDGITIYPEFDPEGTSFTSWHYLKNNIQVLTEEDYNNFFEQLTGFYQKLNIDFYVIDNCMVSGSDDVGAAFVEYLSKQKISEKWILMTNTPKDAVPDYIRNTGRFISKGRDGNEELVTYICQKFNRSRKTKKSRDWLRPIGSAMGFILRVLTVVSFLYGVAVTAHAMYQLTPELFHHGSKKVPIALLEFAEQIFLNFLAFFIFFGFLGYYNTYLENIWFNDNMTKIKKDIATSSLKFSKILFTSSILATLIIKITEELIDDEKKVTPESLIPHGILLIILIFYFFVLEKDERKEEGEENSKH